MKRFNILLALFPVLFACKNAENTQNVSDFQPTETAYVSFGEQIDDTQVENGLHMLETYREMVVKDTAVGTFRAEVKEVCQAKGCWMKLTLPEGQETMVRFKDYGFFVPKDIAGQEVIVAGKAFVHEVSIEEQQHYAAEGQSGPDPDSITEAKEEYGFLAHGVLLPKNTDETAN